MSERMTGGEAVVRTLARFGVDTVFGLPGIQLDPLFDALYGQRQSIRTFHTRHEQGSAYMALGYAQASGKVGVFAVVPGPGGTVVGGTVDEDGGVVVATVVGATVVVAQCEVCFGWMSVVVLGVVVVVVVGSGGVVVVVGGGGGCCCCCCWFCCCWCWCCCCCCCW